MKNPNPSLREVIGHAIVVTEVDHNLESMSPKEEAELINELQDQVVQYIHDLVFQWFVEKGKI